MAETKKILIDLEAKYDSITRAIGRMSDLSVEINATKALIKAQGDVTKENSVSVVRLKTELKAMQKEYNRLNGYVATSTASARAYGYALKESESSLLSVKAQLTEATLAWQGLDAAGRASDFGIALKAQIEALTKTLYDNSTQLDKNKLTVGGYADAMEGLIIKMNKEGVAVGATSQAYSDLLLKYQRAEAAARELILTTGAQSTASEEAVQEVQRLGKELDQLNLHMGKYQSKTVNAQYATFSLTQVMRELPNFAIDARLGFMAISNNLPMLADDFGRLSRQLGSARLAFKAFAKSLLGVNTIMVVLSTVFIAWGPQIMKWVNGIFEGDKRVSSLTRKLDAFGKALKKGDNGLKAAVTSQVKLGVVLKKAEEGTVSAEAAVKTYNETLGKSYGKVNNLAAALEGYKQYSQEFIKAKIAEAAAIKLADDAAEAVLRKEQARIEIQGMANRSQLAGQLKVMQELAKASEGGMATLRNLLDSNWYQIGVMNQALAETPEAVSELEKAFLKLTRMEGGREYAKQLGVMIDATEELSEAEKTIQSLYDGVDFDWTPDPDKTAKDAAVITSRLSEAEAEYREAKVKAEADYQSGAINTQMEYENRLFKIKDEAERKKLDIAFRYGQMEKAEYETRLATLDKIQEEYTNRQTKKASDAIKKTRAEILKLLGDDEAAEVMSVEETYSEKLRLYKEALFTQAELNDEQLYEMEAFELALEIQKQKDLAAIREEYRKKEEDATRASIIKQFADETTAAMQNTDAKYAAEKKRIDAEIALLDTKYEANAKMDEKDAKRYVKLLEDREKNDREYEQHKQKLKEWFMEKSMDIANALNDVLTGFDERAVERLDERHEKEVTQLDERLARGTISRKNYDKEIKKLDEKLDKDKAKIARKQAIRERSLATLSIAMDTAKAIMGIWADFPKMDFGISAGVASAMVGALGVAQAAAVWAQPLPKAERGLLVHGPSHAGGGVPVEVEGGEAIINKKSTTMFKPLLSEINAAGGGVRFAAGGVPVGLANDGGFSARQAVSGFPTLSAREIAQAISEMNIYVSVEQFEREKAKMARAKDRATF